jgi:hypothetical protein
MTKSILWDDAYAPLTSTIGFLASPVEDTAAALRDWRAELHGTAEISRVEAGVPNCLSALEPLTGGVRPRELLIPTTDAGWTALFDCGVAGGDQVTTLGFLAERLGAQAVVVTSVPDSPGRYGARQLELFAPIPTDFLNYVRTISVVREDSGWRFDADGTVQDFEDVGAYRRRRVVDRFTDDMLVEYAAALGLRPYDPAFYGRPALLVTNPSTPPPDGVELTLEEARRFVGAEP